MLDGVGELEALVTWARFLVKRCPLLADTEARSRVEDEALVRQVDLEATIAEASKGISGDLKSRSTRTENGPPAYDDPGPAAAAAFGRWTKPCKLARDAIVILPRFA